MTIELSLYERRYNVGTKRWEISQNKVSKVCSDGNEAYTFFVETTHSTKTDDRPKKKTGKKKRAATNKKEG